jgi:hypothetical protein
MTFVVMAEKLPHTFYLISRHDLFSQTHAFRKGKFNRIGFIEIDLNPLKFRRNDPKKSSTIKTLGIIF